MSVSTRISPVAGEYETAWEPIGKPLYWTENRRLPPAAGKAIAVAALATPPKAQLTAPPNPPIRSARRGRRKSFWQGEIETRYGLDSGSYFATAAIDRPLRASLRVCAAFGEKS